MAEPIVCPLWVSTDYRFRSRHFHAWDRPYELCGRKVVVSDANKRQLESISGTVIVCEQCALARFSEIQELNHAESMSVDPEDRCATCASLKEQVEAAAMELALVKGSADSGDIYQKWAHLFNAQGKHWFKAHNREARGRK